MSDQPQAAPGNNQPAFTIEKIYVKDLSLENPGAPRSFLNQDSPQIDVSLQTRGEQVDNGIYEAVLTLTVTAKLGDATLFLVEAAQAGLFGIRNVPDRAQALREMARVTRPGGRIAILELSEPRGGLMGAMARFHIHTVVPYVGALPRMVLVCLQAWNRVDYSDFIANECRHRTAKFLRAAAGPRTTRTST